MSFVDIRSGVGIQFLAVCQGLIPTYVGVRPCVLLRDSISSDQKETSYGLPTLTTAADSERAREREHVHERLWPTMINA